MSVTDKHRGSMHDWKVGGAVDQIPLGAIFCYWIFFLVISTESREYISIKGNLIVLL